jgi:CMP-N-acetylneuraminic acid synthetase
MIDFIVPARGGSKRLPNKNILPLNGRPLLFYSIDSLLGHDLINNVIFTSDSSEYCERVLEEYGSKVQIIKRPKETAGDKVKVVDEIERLLLDRPELFQSDWFGMVLPTAPLRNFDTVSRLLNFWNQNKKSYFAASEYEFPIQFAFNISDTGDWIPILDDSPMITGLTRSQDIPNLYRPNGAIYIKNIAEFKESKILYKNASPFLISNIEAMDIDTEIDFITVEQIIKNKNKK